MIGKRKRDIAVISREKQNDDDNDDSITPADHQNSLALDILRKHFESQFEPIELALPADGKKPSDAHLGDKSSEEDSHSSDSDGESDWDGISDEGERERGRGSQQAEVVEHVSWRDIPKDDFTEKQARKAFMVFSFHSS